MSFKFKQFRSSGEQVCLEPVLEHRQRRGRRNTAWQAIPHLCSSNRKGTTSDSWPTTGRNVKLFSGGRPEPASVRHVGDTCLFYIVFTVLPQNSWDTGDNSALQSNYLSVSVSSANTQRARCSLRRHRPPFASLTPITRHHRKVSIPHIKTLPTLASIIRACRTCTELHCLKQGTHRPQTPPPVLPSGKLL